MPFKVGERVECNWQHRGANFRGTVSAVNGDLHDIKFDDRDFEGQVPLDRFSKKRFGIKRNYNNNYLVTRLVSLLFFK